MDRTRRSLLYPATYLLAGGAGFALFPSQTLTLCLAAGDYADAMARLVGLLLLGLGVLVVQVIRTRAEAMYSASLVARGVILAGLLVLMFAYRDPLMLVLFAIVGVGWLFTLASLVRDRAVAGRQ